MKLLFAKNANENLSLTTIMKIVITVMMVRQMKEKNVMPVVEWVNIIVLSKTSARIAFTCT